VVALYPDHSEARKVMGTAEERIVKGEEKTGFGMNGILIAAVAIGGVLVLGGVVVVLLLSRRGKSAPATSTPLAAPKSATPPPTGSTDGGYEPTALFDTAVLKSKLVGIAGPLKGTEIPVGAGVMLGRDPERAKVLVKDVQVSGEHVWVGPSGGKIIARDAGSKNGTFLNDDQTNGITEVELKPGDIITLGGGAGVRFQLKR
ncbi:MAG: FHA domain-containing protein, partial [Vicinamibacteria bacterium]